MRQNLLPARLLFFFFSIVTVYAGTTQAQAAVDNSRVTADKRPTDTQTWDAVYPGPFLQAIVKGYTWAVREMLEKGHSANVKDGSEQRLTPILLAVAHKKKDILALLLKHNANIEATDENGLTPLMYACYVPNPDILELLLASGANVNGNGSVSPLMIAAKLGNAELVGKLIDRRADPKLTTQSGATALMVAADDYTIVNSLIKAGGAVNAVDRVGWTALHHAVAEGQLKKIKALLLAGANPNHPDKSGVTARSLAELEKKPDTREAMLTLLTSYAK
jgi:ankyrin repeat protein